MARKRLQTNQLTYLHARNSVNFCMLLNTVKNTLTHRDHTLYTHCVSESSLYRPSVARGSMCFSRKTLKFHNFAYLKKRINSNYLGNKHTHTHMQTHTQPHNAARPYAIEGSFYLNPGSVGREGFNVQVQYIFSESYLSQDLYNVLQEISFSAFSDS